MSFEKAIEAKPIDHDTDNLFYIRIITMTQKLNWSKYNSAMTDTHTYRVEEVGRFISVIYGEKDKQQMQYNDFDSVQAAKQWAQNYHNKYGADHE